MKKKDDKKAVTKVSGLSARVAKADELRRAYKRLADKATRDRKSVVSGKSVDLGGRHIIKKKKPI